MGSRFQVGTKATSLAMGDNKLENGRMETMIQQKFADLEAKLTAGFETLRKNLNNEAANTAGTYEGRETRKVSSEKFRVRCLLVLFENNTNRR